MAEINRRVFLKGTIALGLAPALARLSIETPSELDEAWSALLEAPIEFWVGETGILSTVDYPERRIRNDVYFALPEGVHSATDLQKQVNDIPPITAVLKDAYTEFWEESYDHDNDRPHRADWPEPYDLLAEPAEFEFWIPTLTESQIRDIDSRMRRWLNQEPDWTGYERDFFHFPPHGQSHAFEFLVESEAAQVLGIRIEEGPWVQTELAILNGSIEQANTICEAQSIPVRFRRRDKLGLKT